MNEEVKMVKFVNGFYCLAAGTPEVAYWFPSKGNVYDVDAILGWADSLDASKEFKDVVKEELLAQYRKTDFPKPSSRLTKSPDPRAVFKTPKYSQRKETSP